MASVKLPRAKYVRAPLAEAGAEMVKLVMERNTLADRIDLRSTELESMHAELHTVDEKLKDALLSAQLVTSPVQTSFGDGLNNATAATGLRVEPALMSPRKRTRAASEDSPTKRHRLNITAPQSLQSCRFRSTEPEASAPRASRARDVPGSQSGSASSNIQGSTTVQSLQTCRVPDPAHSPGVTSTVDDLVDLDESKYDVGPFTNATRHPIRHGTIDFEYQSGKYLFSEQLTDAHGEAARSHQSSNFLVRPSCDSTEDRAAVPLSFIGEGTPRSRRIKLEQALAVPRAREEHGRRLLAIMERLDARLSSSRSGESA